MEGPGTEVNWTLSMKRADGTVPSATSHIPKPAVNVPGLGKANATCCQSVVRLLVRVQLLLPTLAVAQINGANTPLARQGI